VAFGIPGPARQAGPTFRRNGGLFSSLLRHRAKRHGDCSEKEHGPHRSEMTTPVGPTHLKRLLVDLAGTASRWNCFTTRDHVDLPCQGSSPRRLANRTGSFVATPSVKARPIDRTEKIGTSEGIPRWSCGLPDATHNCFHPSSRRARVALPIPRNGALPGGRIGRSTVNDGQGAAVDRCRARWMSFPVPNNTTATATHEVERGPRTPQRRGPFVSSGLSFRQASQLLRGKRHFRSRGIHSPSQRELTPRGVNGPRSSAYEKNPMSL